MLGGNLVWTTLCLGGYRAETMVVSWTLTALLLAVHLIGRAVEGENTAVSRPWREWASDPALWAVGFLVYAAANAAWVSPVPWLGWRDWLGCVQAFGVVWVVATGLRSMPSRRALFALVLGLALVAVFLACYQRFARPDWLMLGRLQSPQFLGRSSGPFGIPNSLAGLLILLLPACGALALRREATATERVWWVWVTAVLLVGLVLTVSRGAWLALAGALVMWPLLSGGRRLQRRLAVAAGILAAVLASGVLIAAFSDTARERLGNLIRDRGELSRPILWRAGANLFLDEPLLGTGAGSYNVLFERYRPKGFIDEPAWAHNEYLNLASDYGLVGVGLLAMAAVLWIRRAARSMRVVEPSPRPIGALSTPLVRRALFVGVVAFAFQSVVDFHLKIPALAMIAAVMVALLDRPASRNAGDARTPMWRWGLVAGGVLVCAILGGAAVAIFRAEALRAGAREAADRLVGASFAPPLSAWQMLEHQLRRAVDLDSANARAWADLAGVYQQQARSDPASIRSLGEKAEAAARRALECTEVVAEFWTRLGVSLNMTGQHAEADDCYRRAVALAPNHRDTWYYYAYHLSLDPRRKQLALDAIANCLALDPGNPPAEALLQQLKGRR